METEHTHVASVADALDFVNTREQGRDGYTDTLPDLAAALGWLEARGLLHAVARQRLLWAYAADPESESNVLRRVRRVREALRELLDATHELRRPAREALAEINRALRTGQVLELVPADDGITLDHRHDGDPVDEALSRLAEPIAREVSGAAAGRLRVCANDECRWVFRDESAAGRRKWCSMAVCGNRAKVARHRQRQRAQVAVSGDPAGTPLSS